MHRQRREISREEFYIASKNQISENGSGLLLWRRKFAASKGPDLEWLVLRFRHEKDTIFRSPDPLRMASQRFSEFRFSRSPWSMVRGKPVSIPHNVTIGFLC